MNIAYLPCDLHTNRLGLPSQLTQPLAGVPVLQWTLQRATRIVGIDRVVLACPADQAEELQALIDSFALQAPAAIEVFPVAHELLWDDRFHWRRVARAWNLPGWRGGLGGACVYDELLPPQPIARAMDHCNADAVVLLGPDWVLLDPEKSSECLATHLEEPEAMKLVFTQAPPGLCGLACSKVMIDRLCKANATIGHALMYQPQRPAPDPLNREVCLSIPATTRSLARRFVADTPRSMNLLGALADHLGHRFVDADLQQVGEATVLVESEQTTSDIPTRFWHELPQQSVLPLTPQRHASGPIVPPPPPPHSGLPGAEPISLQTARAAIDRLAPAQDACLTLGGNGDALFHPDLSEILQHARDAGLFAVCVETDLLCSDDELQQLLNLPVDVLSVRINADTKETYEQVMGIDAFEAVVERVRIALNTVHGHAGERGETTRSHLPWIVPRIAKTSATIGEMETFFDRWLTFAGHAVIDPPPPGCALDNGSMLQLSAPASAMNPEFLNLAQLDPKGKSQRRATDPAYALT